MLTQRLYYALLSLILLAQSVSVRGSSEGTIELFYLDQMKDSQVYNHTFPFLATLTASKALSVPGGYVVPVHHDVVFRCHVPDVHRDNILRWNIVLGPLTLNRTTTLELERESNHKLTVNENYKSNPAEVQIYNLQLNESGSKIQCLGYGIQEVMSSISHIFVEGQLSIIKLLAII